ncbi:MAG: glycosyltransferase family 4 protein [Deltaproteobacteria bacterium]|nr:glycosyltransferase family 4 protein [Deltaproteobacteria bacterium]
MSHPAVLFVGSFLSAAGTHRSYCEDLTDRLEAREWRVIRTSTRRGRISRLSDILRTAWTRRRDYALAHVDLFSGPAFVWGEAVCFELARLGKPFVLTLHGGNLPTFSRRWPRRTRRLLRSAARVTAPSDYLRAALAPLAREVVVIPNAVDVAEFAHVPRSRLQPRLVWLRAFHDVYNPVMAVDVLAKIAARHPGATLTMVGGDKGDGSLERVRQRAAELGVTERLTIVPGVPKRDVPRYLAAGDIFLNTTNADNSPVSVLEALACGLCVVTTSVGGIPHMLHHERDAMLVPANDASAMAAAVERLLAQPALAQQLSTSGRNLAVSADWSAVLARWEGLFETIARAA